MDASDRRLSALAIAVGGVVLLLVVGPSGRRASPVVEPEAEAMEAAVAPPSPAAGPPTSSVTHRGGDARPPAREMRAQAAGSGAPRPLEPDDEDHAIAAEANGDSQRTLRQVYRMETEDPRRTREMREELLARASGIVEGSIEVEGFSCGPRVCRGYLRFEHEGAAASYIEDADRSRAGQHFTRLTPGTADVAPTYEVLVAGAGADAVPLHAEAPPAPPRASTVYAGWEGAVGEP